MDRLLIFFLFLGFGQGATVSYAQWVEAPGKGWVQMSVYHHDTTTQFDTRGEEMPFFSDGRAVTTSAFVTAALGLVHGVDVWVQAPLHRLRFENSFGRRDRTGVGDPRIYLRLGAGLFGRPEVPFAVRGGVKLVGGDFPVDAEVIPLGEGQRDWEVMLELGHSFHPRPVYVTAWAGRRWREPNRAAGRDPGDEWFFYLGAGGQEGRFGWKVAAEGWQGETPVLENLPVRSARQEMLQVLPTVGWTLGPGAVEVGARLPLAGRNFPAGAAVVFGYFTRWRLW